MYKLNFKLEAGFSESPIVSSTEGFHKYVNLTSEEIDKYREQELIRLHETMGITVGQNGVTIKPITMMSGNEYFLDTHNHPKLKQNEKYILNIAEFNIEFEKDTPLKNGQVANKRSVLSFGIYVLTNGVERYKIYMCSSSLPTISMTLNIITLKIVCNMTLESVELGNGSADMTVFYPLVGHKWKIFNNWSLGFNNKN